MGPKNVHFFLRRWAIKTKKAKHGPQEIQNRISEKSKRMCQRAKISNVCHQWASPPPPKKMGVDGLCAKMCQQNRNEEDGLSKIKERLGNAHLFEVHFRHPSFAYP